MLDFNLKIEANISINASSAVVWEAIVNPEKVKQYFFGVNVSSDWKVGSPIDFTGEYEGVQYHDKGVITSIETGLYLVYDYWSGFSGLKDESSNYSKVTYSLNEESGVTTVTVNQEGFIDDEKRQHSQSGWEAVLQGLKQISDQD